VSRIDNRRSGVFLLPSSFFLLPSSFFLLPSSFFLPGGSEGPALLPACDPRHTFGVRDVTDAGTAPSYSRLVLTLTLDGAT
jgi:hypothetical protein